MSGDKRTVSTDALETLGTCPIPDGSGRDAIHIAVEPCVAAEKLYPGQDVALLSGSEAYGSGEHVGIVDPFLKGPLQKGERFWLLVYPRQITSLRHVWSHPKFADGSAPPLVSNSASETWIRNFLENADLPEWVTYEHVLESARTGNWVNRGKDDDYCGIRVDGNFQVNGNDACGSIPDAFWTHLEIVTGMKFGVRSDYFYCSC